MATKFYAVRNGLKVGIVETWAECQAMTKGVSGVEFKSFTSREEAEAYMNGEDTPKSVVEIAKPTDGDHVNLYVVGGEDDKLSAVGVVIETQSKMYRFFGSISCPEFQALRAIGSKLLGVLVGVQLCREMGFRFIHIVSDYEGVEKWYNGSWAAKGVPQNHYISMMNKFRFGSLLEYTFTLGTKSVPGCKAAKQMQDRAKVRHEYIDADKILQGSIGASDVPLYSIS